jgi:hypothetical protein
MFVKMYRYQVKKADLPEWRRIMRKAGKIYKAYGDKSTELFRLGKTVGKYVTILEIDFYKTKRDYAAIEKKVDKDEKLNELWDEFLELARGGKWEEEEFETLEC